MKRTGNLFNTIISFGNLWLAAHKAWRGKKDKTRIADFYFNLERELIGNLGGKSGDGNLGWNSRDTMVGIPGTPY